MKHLQLIVITICLILAPSFILAKSTDIYSVSAGASEPHSDQKKDQIEDKDKQKLKEDAKKIGEDFKELLSDLTQLSKDTISPLADSLSEWIVDNYAKLSEESREKLIDFLENLKKEYKNIEEMSLDTLKNILQTVTDFFNQLKKENTIEPEDSVKETSDKAVI